MASVIQYRVKVHHDSGVANLFVNADNAQSAKQIVIKCENCPESAIKRVKPIRIVFNDGTQTDSKLTGKYYKKIDCFGWKAGDIKCCYLGSSIQFKTCKGFKNYMSEQNKTYGFVKLVCKFDKD